MNEREIHEKISRARGELLKDYPFFGRLLLRLKLGLANCRTAFTDMRRIVFDPEFAERLSGKEIKFVLLHEVLHCAVKHCTRSCGKNQFVYNVACDIVVNSTIFDMWGGEFVVNEQVPMHTAPDGTEGSTKTAEEVYDQLMQMPPDDFAEKYGGGYGCTDIHDMWGTLDSTVLEGIWDKYINEVAKMCGMDGIPGCMERYLKKTVHTSKTDWRQLLHDFIQTSRMDYDFSVPDKRYSSDFILPSFCENAEGSKIEKLWFLVDTSASVTDDDLAVAYSEIEQATKQIERISGMVSFFDTEVTDPVSFDSFDDIADIVPMGGGGTDYYEIFDKLQEFGEEELPVSIVIITDGYALYPPEEEALGVPVIWLIVNSKIVPPWGVVAYVDVDGDF